MNPSKIKITVTLDDGVKSTNEATITGIWWEKDHIHEVPEMIAGLAKTTFEEALEKFRLKFK